ncbi:carotenoid biosynthesis protein [Nitrosomonas aestuarii]|uniref:carotenoid biosynthesis protein n=1 Tax=Nitrosomonas aestuarii TaxID=52441 RepID=UPI000D413FBF|nr:carotenoid biosynthesis protein [Nitrosomonas aestuarii]PTN13308.1 putative membrane protein [Nitrosomonas aestuarii]
MFELFYSFTFRPYVTLFLLAFLTMSWLEQGGLRTGIWLLTGCLVALAAEWGSINHGIPFGYYAYHYEVLARDLVVFGVPFFDSLSFVFLSYVSFTFAQFFLSAHWRCGWNVQRVTTRNLRNSTSVLFVGAFFMMVLDLIIDPVAHLGKHWFLGDIYHYPAPGWHFDITLANYAGWFIVGWTIIFINQRVDAALNRCELSGNRPLQLRYIPGKGLFAPLFWFGIAVFALGVTAWLGWGYDLEHVTAAERESFVAETRKLFLAGTFIIAPIAVLAWTHLVRRDSQPPHEQLAAWLKEYPSIELKSRWRV